MNEIKIMREGSDVGQVYMITESLTDKVEMILKTNVRESETISLPEIAEMVYSYLRIDIKYLNNPSRKREYVYPRQLCYYLARMFTNKSYNDIGNTIGKKNHATVLNSVRSITNDMQYDADIKKHVNELKTILG